jgi:hypothetical protein
MAQRRGVRLKVFTGQESRIAERLGEADLLIVFTNKVSHEARHQVVRLAKSRDIPLRLIHSCGLSTLHGCLEDFALAGPEPQTR